MRIKSWDIWAEGYTNKSYPTSPTRAILMGIGFGATFENACVEFFMNTQKWDCNSFNASKLTFWGSQLFDNEKEARKSFG